MYSYTIVYCDLVPHHRLFAMNCSSISIQSPLSNWHRIRCMHVMYHIRITYIITISFIIKFHNLASILLYTLHIIYPPSTLPSARLFKGCYRFLHVTLEVQGTNHHEERDPEPITAFCQIWCYKHATSYGCYGTIHHEWWVLQKWKDQSQSDIKSLIICARGVLRKYDS